MKLLKVLITSAESYPLPRVRLIFLRAFMAYTTFMPG